MDKLCPTVSGDPTDYGVTIVAAAIQRGIRAEHRLDHFQSAVQAYKVQVCVVALEDLANFVDDWLLTGPTLMATSRDNEVKFDDYSIVAWYWQDYCPAGWQLK